FWKPEASMTTSYGPGGRLGRVKRPEELLAVSRVRPVFSPFTEILAPETTAPLASCIVPAIWPFSFWANAKPEHSSRIANREIVRSAVRFMALSTLKNSVGENRPITDNARQ